MTETQPPAAKEGCDLCYRSGKWAQVERPKPAPEPVPPTETGEAQEPYNDDVRHAAFEAMAEQEGRLIAQSERIAAIEAKLGGGEGK